MDEKSIQILSHLRGDARKNLSVIGRELNMPISTIHDKVKRFEKEAVKKFTALIDFQKLGLNSVHMIIKCGTQKERVKEYLVHNQNINSIYELNSGYDFLLEVVFKELKELDHMITMLKQYDIRNIEEFVTKNEIKREGYLMG
ncbi:winged helix-turn-helix transcriptional regulator [Candidatus Woesearchaeota archaeon]|jgi:DNA-binding Lrp family transcriptional regulator|nr:winged helix-turn-helix transcriptional regulator [Candidatus Woesearchaeota archaeon]MBT6519108.1 winged helix-turn-helix transcriptional regulator [Candidatus Woesearchaeota archaeon]MBT7366980.1 winged helix-turn-helix transcriptional regulator [Candidatus Woesearchaeota archaeon]